MLSITENHTLAIKSRIKRKLDSMPQFDEIIVVPEDLEQVSAQLPRQTGKQQLLWVILILNILYYYYYFLFP